MDTYIKAKYLSRLDQHQKLLKTKINPQVYWQFVEHLGEYLKITGIDVDLRQTSFMGKTIFKINLEIYFEKNPRINYKMMKHIFQLYFYQPHDTRYGQDFLFITMIEPRFNDKI